MGFSPAAHGATAPIANFESNITVNNDGSAVVLENVQLAFPAASFQREIRTRFDGPLGSRNLLVDVVEVADESGNPVPFYVLHYPSSLEVRTNGKTLRSVKIIYGVRNAVMFGAESDQFLWIATPPDASLASASVNVTLPGSVAGQFRTQTYLRSQSGENLRTALWSYSGMVPVQVEGTVIRSGAPGPLAPGVAMIVDVSMAGGLITPPNALVRASWFVRANPILLLPLLVLLAMLVVRRMKPRNAAGGRSVAPLYEPPEGLTPAEMGLLIDDRIDPRDICATLIDLAVRGYVKLEECKPEFGAEPDYIVKLMKPGDRAIEPSAHGTVEPSDAPQLLAAGIFSMKDIAARVAGWDELAAHERTMLFHTFYGGQWTKLSSLKLRFPEIVPYMKDDIMRSLKVRGVYRVDPEAAQKWRQAALGAVLVLLFLAQMIGVVALAQSQLLSGISMTVSIVIVYWLGRDMSAKSWRGVRLWTAVRGFEEFLRTVEGDRLRRMQPGIFEKYLPYAMALGIEHRWTLAFEGIAIETPEWGEAAQFMLGNVVTSRPRGKAANFAI